MAAVLVCSPLWVLATESSREDAGAAAAVTSHGVPDDAAYTRIYFSGGGWREYSAASYGRIWCGAAGTGAWDGKAAEQPVLGAGVVDQSTAVGDFMAAEQGAGEQRRRSNLGGRRSGGRRERELARSFSAVNWEDEPPGSWMEQKVSG
ncbi:uncharacterized protein [Triticum aestivum]|uniref:uncharacterized protein n=1 Tax=Triticum aestivum TaxID=4565 RepID=UPI001D032410|nr:uncharacterized protein LOC123124214 [Triticum aestivum]